MSIRAAPDILCIGAVLWDTVGRVETSLERGADLPGRVARMPGGVAFNVAAALRGLGMMPTLLTAVGADRDGEALVAECARRGIDASHVHRAAGMRTDRYLAIEDGGGLVAAVADVHTLESAGAEILAPLADGRLAVAGNPWRGLIALDGNLSAALLAKIAVSPLFFAADLRVASASVGKVARLHPFLSHPRATLYLNREEAGLLCAREFTDAVSAAEALINAGVSRVLVTDGACLCADAKRGEPIVTAQPPAVRVNRVTGAGDTFMAAHIVAEKRGAPRATALANALAAASRYVTGELGS